MPYVLVEDFKSGIDTRRTAVTSVPGSLYGLDASGTAGLTNAHITRGGEIEKRKAFKLWADLTGKGTHGLAAGGGRVFVFGSAPTPDLSTQPPSLSYYRMEHQFGQPPTSGAYAMAEVLSVDFFNGEPYAAIEFENGQILHYWGDHSSPAFTDNSVSPPNRIADHYDGRARVSLTVNGGTAIGTAAEQTIIINGGSSIPGDNLRFLRVNNVDIIPSPIAHTGSDNTTADAIVAAINGTTTTPNYTAAISGGDSVIITAATAGSASNGYPVTYDLEGNFSIRMGSDTTLRNGADNCLQKYTDINGVDLLDNDVIWETSHTYTAQKIADAINSTPTDPEWEAVANGATVTIIAEEPGTAYNNLTFTPRSLGNLSLTNVTTSTGTTGSSVPLSSGTQSGSFVRSNKYAMHVLEESTWKFCATNNPGDWTTGLNNANGAGFQILSNHARNSEELMAIETYYENMAIFAQDCIQIWYYDPDPALLQLVQVLTNTGTIASKSVQKIGDSDVFYLSRSGIRSLKAKDSSNSAILGDIGNPIDEMIIQAIQDDPADGRNSCAMLDPRTGRYYLAIGEKVYVFSYFPSSGVSAWSVYEPGFEITDWAFDGKQVLCRSGDKIYSLGGENDDEYDSCKVTVQLPFLDAQTPATNKMWSGIDAVCSSTWSVKTAPDPTDIETNELSATLNKVTYGLGRVGLSTTSTHMALRLENEQSGAAKLGNLAVHYTLNEAG